MTTITSPSGLITAAPERGPLGDDIFHATYEPVEESA